MKAYETAYARHNSRAMVCSCASMDAETVTAMTMAAVLIALGLILRIMIRV